MKKILVTGGAGFIGSHTVVELQNAGYEPVIVDSLFNASAEVVDNIAKITRLDNRKLKTNKIPEGSCDFSYSNGKLQELRDQSINHLKSILKGDEIEK